MGSRTIGVIGTWTGLANGIFAAARERGCSTLFHVVENDTVDHCRDLLQENLDAYIFISPAPQTIRDAERLYLAGKPVVIILRKSSIAPVMMVDMSLAVTEMVDYFVELGHRDILFMTGSNNEQGRVRLQGYYDGLEKHAIPRRPELIIDTGYFGSMQSTELTLEWMSKGVEATAAVFANRMQATDAMSVFLAKGMQVPEDIAVATIDEPSMGPAWVRDITCWRQPVTDMGHRAVECIWEQFDKPKAEPMRIDLKCEKVIRKSCGGNRTSRTSAGLMSDFRPTAVIKEVPQGIPYISSREVEKIGQRVDACLRSPKTIVSDLHEHIQSLEKMGMYSNCGFSFIVDCRDHCLAHCSSAEKGAFRKAFREVIGIHSQWLNFTHHRLQKERVGLTRENTFLPSYGSTDDRPVALVNGLKQQLIPRGVKRFSLQIKSWDESAPIYYEWQEPERGKPERAVQEHVGKCLMPDELFLALNDGEGYGLFNLSNDMSMDYWLLIDVPEFQFPAIREIALQFSSGYQAFNLYTIGRHKRLELEEARRNAVGAQEQAEAARIEAEKAAVAKDHFLANMSHEMRTPMNGVMGLTDILLESDLDSFQKSRLSIIQEASNELLTTIANVLDLSKIEAGKMILESVDFDLWEELGSILIETYQLAEAKGLQFYCRIDPKLPSHMMGDPDRLRQVLRNLLSNAIKYTNDGYVYLNVYPAMQNDSTVELQFSIEDTGIGIEDEEIERLFNLFENGPQGIDQMGSRGLELTIARKLVQQMSGRIWVQSMKDVGSVFFFTALFDRDDRPSYEDLVRSDMRLRKKRILVLDTMGVSRNIYKEAFSIIADDVSLAKNYDDVLATLDSESGLPFDCLIYDVKHYDEADRSFIRKLRMLNGLKGPILLVVPQDEISEYNKLSVLPSVHCLSKPFHFGVIQDKLPKILRNDSSGIDPEASREKPALRVLLAEDNMVNVEVVRSLLCKRGHDVMLAIDGNQALALFKRSRYDLVLMDINMPGLDGYATTRSIRKIEENTAWRTRILALTAHDSGEVRSDCLEAGMDGLVTKPIQKSQFIKEIENLESPEGAISSSVSASDDGDGLKGRILDYVGDDMVFLKKMQDALQVSIQSHEARLYEAIKGARWEEVADIAHYFKSTLGSFGSDLGQGTSIKLEKESKVGNTKALLLLARQLSHYLKFLDTKVQEILDDRGSVKSE